MEMELPNTNSNPKPGAFSCFQIPPHTLDDLCSRFIINVPEEERQDLIRIFFQIELAHWFYLDFYCQEKDELKPCGIKDFSSQIFRHCPFLKVHSDRVEKIFEDWREYKMSVPTYGAIMINPSLTRVVMVQGFWAKSSWMFPKGKVNEEEKEVDCAIREVYEETGYDVKHLIDENSFIEHRMNEQLIRLYIVPGVPEDTNFEPRTRKEIRRIEWFDIDCLPAHKKDLTPKTKIGLTPNQFFMVVPFVKHLRRFITKRTGKWENNSKNSDVDKCRSRENTPDKSDSSQFETNSSKKHRLLLQQQQQQIFAAQQQGLLELVGDIKGNQYKTSPKKTGGYPYNSASQYDGYHNTSYHRSSNTGTERLSHQKKLNDNDQHRLESQQAVKILKRDGTLCSQKRYRTNRITDSSEDELGYRLLSKNLPINIRKEEFHSQAWLNFTFDVQKIMSVFK